MKTNSILFAVLLTGASAFSSFAQPAFDSTGDGQLNGNYYLRQIVYFEGQDENGGNNLGRAINMQGEITFNGGGSFTFNGTLLDSSSGSSTPVNVSNETGTYVVSASGEGYITGINPDFPSDTVIGLVSHGVFIGSSTETNNGYNDLLIAAPIGSVANNGTLNGTYQVAYLDPTVPGDAIFSMTANGSGGIGTVNATEYIATNAASTQSLSGVTYNFTNGAAQLSFGGSNSNLIFGTEVLYITPDGNFIFGGSANGFDMFVGVRAATSNPSNYQALYYQAGVDFDLTGYPSDAGFDSYFGAMNILSAGETIVDERDNSLAFYDGSADFTYTGGYTLNGDGSASDGIYTYWASTDGTIRIGYGLGPYLGINVAFQGPSLTGSGVYLSPMGVVNAASNAPFTAFISPGEFLTLYGSGLAPSTASANVPFPNTLNGVQVLINEVPAPIYFVSPGQISVIVPYVTSQAVAQIQVMNNNAPSNVVTQFTGLTSVGVFTNTPVGGTGIAAAERPDYSIVSEANPAQVGETVSLYMAGMGSVTNEPGDGAPAPSSPLADTTETPTIHLIDTAGNSPEATVTFSGLAPGFAGLYQINFTIPTGLVTGDTVLDLYSGVDSETAESILPITNTTTAAEPAARPKARSPLHRSVRHHLAPIATPLSRRVE
jgi:uncharacterized protein (TIGR03437 family)